MKRQRPTGEWLQEGLEGVSSKSWFVRPSLLPFSYDANRGSMISYPNYKFIFTIMALGMFSRTFGDKEMAL